MCRVTLKKLWVEYLASFAALWQCCQDRALQQIDDSAEIFVVGVASKIHRSAGILFQFISKSNRIKKPLLNLHKNYYLV